MDATNLKFAPYPFDDEQADLILRTSDGVHFRIHKIILSLTSRVFKDMLSLPPADASTDGSADEMFNGLHIVPVAENASALDLALRFLYPLPSPAVTLANMATLLEFSNKYEVQFHDFQFAQCLREEIPNDAVGVYILAHSYNIVDVARQAAAATCRLHLRSIDSPLLCHITASQYRKLFLWRYDAGLALEKITASNSWYIKTPGCVFASKSPCQTCYTSVSLGWYMHKSFSEYLVHIREAFAQGAGSACILNDVNSYARASQYCGTTAARCSAGALPSTALRPLAEALATAAARFCSEMSSPL
ncbi:unnamed protein product [Peniophora sp. CBMAI 1063]|nr:unnamed protein product [Peniophora sp. CBMAI 1063]